MDLYTTPSETVYLTGLTKWFKMATGDGKLIPAVAVSREAGVLWGSGYTILLTLIFVAGGKIVVDWALTYTPLRGNGNRHALLVAFYNTTDPISAMFLMANYQWKLLTQIRTKNNTIDWRTFLLATLYWCIQAGILAGSTAAGIIVPAEMLMGNVARANPAAIFYPELVTETQGKQREANNRLLSIASSRAIGTVEYAWAALEKQVKFNDNPLSIETTLTGTQRNVLKLEYEYNLTGLDFGLQRAPTLKQLVKGSCVTEYGWYQKEESERLDNVTETRQIDVYALYGNMTDKRNVTISKEEPPRALFQVGPEQVDSAKHTGITKYTILPFTADRRMRDPIVNDPWYATRAENDFTTQTQYVVRRGRPAISCEHTTQWQYGNLVVGGYERFEDLVAIGLDLAPFWYKTVFTREFANAPPIVTMSRSLGAGNLATPNQGFLDYNVIQNSQVNIVTDLKRLILGSYVYSREVVRNTAILRPNTEGLRNAAATGENLDGPVLDETADFIIESGDIQTMSVRVLIITPSIFVLLWIWILFRKRIMSIRLDANNNEHWRTKFVTRSTGLSAVHLYRYLDEELNGLRRWYGRLSSAPHIKTVEEDELKRSRKDRAIALEEFVPVSAQCGDGVLRNVLVPRKPSLKQLEIPVASRYVVPKMMPLWQTGPRPQQVQEGEVGAEEVEDRYELAMTRTWRPRVKDVDRKALWDEQVMQGVEVTRADEATAVEIGDDKLVGVRGQEKELGSADGSEKNPPAAAK